MRHFPAFHDVTDRSCLVVGAGESAARKVRLLRQAGARIVVVAPRACEELAALAADRVLELRRRPFRSGDVVGQVLVVSATGHDGVDRLVAAAAEAAGVPVNVVDRPGLSSFIVPAIVDRDPIMIGISSGAAAPLLARRIREHLETVLPVGLGRLAAFAESFRGAVKATIPAGTRRLRFLGGRARRADRRRGPGRRPAAGPRAHDRGDQRQGERPRGGGPGGDRRRRPGRSGPADSEGPQGAATGRRRGL